MSEQTRVFVKFIGSPKPEDGLRNTHLFYRKAQAKASQKTTKRKYSIKPVTTRDGNNA